MKQITIGEDASARRRRRRLGAVLGAGLAVAAIATACQPGDVLPFAGNGTAGSAGDAGPAAEATLLDPGSVAAIPDVGGFYVVDHSACVIRRVDAAKTITAVAGTGTCGTSGDGGPATAAQIAPTSSGSASFQSIAVTADGTLYFADAGSGTVRRISEGTITKAGEQPGCDALGVVTGPDDRIYVNCTYTIGRLESDGSITTMASPSSMPPFSAFAVGSSTEFMVAAGTGRAQDIIALTGDGSGSTSASLVLSYGDDINAMAFDATGTLLYVASENSALIGRLGMGASTLDIIAGNGAPDPGTTAQSGQAIDLALVPRGLALTPNHGMVFSSGHVVYRLEGPADAPAATMPTLPDDTSTTTSSSTTTTIANT